MALFVITLILIIFISIQTFYKTETENFRGGRRSPYDINLASPWQTGMYRAKFPYGGYDTYPIRGHYLDLNYPSRKYAAPHWYSSVTLAQQGLGGLPYYDDYYYHKYY